MWIKVTKKDIKEGNRKYCTTCPIALALNRYIDDHIVVCPQIIYFSKGWFGCGIPLPKTAQIFILRFDVGDRVRPFKFWLPVS